MQLQNSFNHSKRVTAAYKFQNGVALALVFKSTDGCRQRQTSSGRVLQIHKRNSLYQNKVLAPYRANNRYISGTDHRCSTQLRVYPYAAPFSWIESWKGRCLRSLLFIYILGMSVANLVLCVCVLWYVMSVFRFFYAHLYFPVHTYLIPL